MDVFWEHGYEAASLSQLLKQMGIGKKSLYDTFGNKQSLFLKALEHYAQTTLRDIKERLSAEVSSRLFLPIPICLSNCERLAA
ncbi:MAG: TetR/AcrR family transcriptional regulator, partial [Cyanobacteria bacterium P01_F01_bin.86]